MGRRKKTAESVEGEQIGGVKVTISEVSEVSDGKNEISKGQNKLSEEDMNKLKEKWPECDRCHKKSGSSLVRLNTVYITGMAGYWRDSPEIVGLCRECCKELSGIVDKWLINKGDGVKVKRGRDSKNIKTGEEGGDEIND